MHASNGSDSTKIMLFIIYKHIFILIFIFMGENEYSSLLDFYIAAYYKNNNRNIYIY